jgi:hypothetical protein
MTSQGRCHIAFHKWLEDVPRFALSFLGLVPAFEIGLPSNDKVIERPPKGDGSPSELSHLAPRDELYRWLFPPSIFSVIKPFISENHVRVPQLI